MKEIHFLLFASFVTLHEQDTFPAYVLFFFFALGLNVFYHPDFVTFLPTKLIFYVLSNLILDRV